jgi:hypothetical protein
MSAPGSFLVSGDVLVPIWQPGLDPAPGPPFHTTALYLPRLRSPIGTVLPQPNPRQTTQINSLLYTSAPLRKTRCVTGLVMPPWTSRHRTIHRRAPKVVVNGVECALRHVPLTCAQPFPTRLDHAVLIRSSNTAVWQSDVPARTTDFTVEDSKPDGAR